MPETAEDFSFIDSDSASDEGDSGQASTPSPQPAPAPAPAESVSSPPTPQVPPAVPQQAAPPQAQPVQQPQYQQQQYQQPQQQPPTPPQPQATPQQPQVPQQQPLPQQPPQISREEMQRQRQAWVDNLTKQYALTPEQQDIMQTEPHRVLPGMAANIAVNTYEAIVTYFNYAMPHMIQQLINQTATHQGQVDNFFKTWPQLNASDPVHARAIQAASATYRQFNPTATPEQAIQDIGRTAIGMLGLQPGVPNGQPHPQGVRPFAHAAPGVTSAVPTTTQRAGSPASDNFFTQLVNEADLSDL